MGALRELRYEPSKKRVRAVIGGTTIADSTRAVLIWEPRRVVPSYAVPRDDVHAELRPAQKRAGSAVGEVGLQMPEVADIPVLDPSIPFGVHTADGEALDLHADGRTHHGLAFEPADPDLKGYVSLDFDGFDEWFEEDETLVSHPRNPFSRIDTRQSSRTVRIELEGTVLAESNRPLMLFETGLPVRYYLPREDIRVTLTPTSKQTACAYKGWASYFSVELDDRTVEDVAWTYPAPLRDTADIRDLISFFDERVDLVVDGARKERPVTPWSR